MKLLTGLSIILISTLHASSQHASYKATVPLRDLSAPGSPLRASGRAEFFVNFSDETVVTRQGLQGKVTNVSSQAVLAFEASLDLLPGHGGGTSRTYEIDYFLQSELLAPGSEFIIQVEPKIRNAVPYHGDRSPDKGKAEFRVLYVQFADGTTFGKSTWGDGLRADRQSELAVLNNLLQSYDRAKETGLVAAIANGLANRDYSPSVNQLLDSISRVIRHSGAEAGVREIRTYLQNARRRVSTM